jgi:hypothetical protein
MTEQEMKMEQCHHVWVYDHRGFDDVWLRCPRCGMIRMAMPGETCHIVSRELKIRHDGKDGDV